MSDATAALSRLILLLIRVYQLFLSPFLGGQCRFEPSCSRYTQQCIEHFGPFRGSRLGAQRILRCHPFCQGGFDPPPGVSLEQASSQPNSRGY